MDKLLPYFSFAGRANRQRYWLVVLATYALMLLVGLFAMVIPFVGPAIAGIVIIGGVWVSLAISSRRLHDRNKSAWWLVAMYLPIAILSALGALVGDEAGAAFDALSLPFSIWILVELGCLKGTEGPNRFGPDPLDPTPVEVFN